MKRHLFLFIILIQALTSWAADQHFQTTAHPKTGDLTLEIPNDNQVKLNLYDPDVTYTKYDNGQLKFLIFSTSKMDYELYFYPQKYFIKEKIALIKRFKTVYSSKLLNGLSEQYDQNGQLIATTSWKLGKLNGRQAFYHSFTNILLEERHFENNLPVGKWSTYYSSGSPSAELLFPSTSMEWKHTEISAPVSQHTTRLSLFTANFPNPFTSKLVWYYPNGNKLKEIEYIFYKNGKRIIAIKTGKATFYNKKGKVIGKRNTPQGNGEEIFTIPSLGILYKTKTTWFNHTIFKTINLSTSQENP